MHAQRQNHPGTYGFVGGTNTERFGRNACLDEYIVCYSEKCCKCTATLLCWICTFIATQSIAHFCLSLRAHLLHVHDQLLRNPRKQLHVRAYKHQIIVDHWVTMNCKITTERWLATGHYLTNGRLLPKSLLLQWNFSKPDPQKTESPWISADFFSPFQAILCKVATPLKWSYFWVPVLAGLEKFHCIPFLC
jgi:hypothetical protein